MEPLRSNQEALILAPAPKRLLERPPRALALRAVGLLTALVATPQRAIFAAGLAFGLAGPRLVRFAAGRAFGGALRLLGRPRRGRASVFYEVILQQVIVRKVVGRAPE